VYRFLATGENTNGKYAIWEAIVPPGGGPPPHVHSREEEGFYILEGEITLHAGDKQVFGYPMKAKAKKLGMHFGVFQILIRF